jgi:hypothetical protein
MAHFQTKNHDLGKFWRNLAMEGASILYVHFAYFMTIWYFCGNLVFVRLFGISFPRFGMLYQEKSGNPGGNH